LTPRQVRIFALSLPDSVENDHHGIPSFRVNEKIFATLWDEDYLNVFLDPVRIMEVAEAHPDVCEEFWWGRKLSCVHVSIKSANPKLVKELLREAWTRRATPYRRKGQ
jgi:hypothetical protein